MKYIYKNVISDELYTVYKNTERIMDQKYQNAN